MTIIKLNADVSITTCNECPFCDWSDEGYNADCELLAMQGLNRNLCDCLEHCYDDTKRDNCPIISIEKA